MLDLKVGPAPFGPTLVAVQFSFSIDLLRGCRGSSQPAAPGSRSAGSVDAPGVGEGQVRAVVPPRVGAIAPAGLQRQDERQELQQRHQIGAARAPDSGAG